MSEVWLGRKEYPTSALPFTVAALPFDEALVSLHGNSKAATLNNIKKAKQYLQEHRLLGSRKDLQLNDFLESYSMQNTPSGLAIDAHFLRDLYDHGETSTTGAIMENIFVGVLPSVFSNPEDPAADITALGILSDVYHALNPNRVSLHDYVKLLNRTMHNTQVLSPYKLGEMTRNTLTQIFARNSDETLVYADRDFAAKLLEQYRTVANKDEVILFNSGLIHEEASNTRNRQVRRKY